MTLGPTSLWGFISHAGLVVRIVMVLLAFASLMSWTFIFQRIAFLHRANKDYEKFENDFWSGLDLNRLFSGLNRQKEELHGMASIFYSGFKEFSRLSQQETDHSTLIEGCQRIMRVAQSREQEKLEQHLSFLATVGSISPFVGLFGTVWGIMTSFQALGAVQQATISMVAPGISEALIATAMGLFAAIPAVVAYNRFTADADRLSNHYQTFQDEFTNILQRQINSKKIFKENTVPEELMV